MKRYLLLFIFIGAALPLYAHEADSHVVAPEVHVKASTFDHKIETIRAQGSSQWLLSLDKIQSIAQMLVTQNSVLRDRYDRLSGEYVQLKNRINDTKKNIAEQQTILGQRNKKLKELSHGGHPLEGHIDQVSQEIESLTQAHSYTKDQIQTAEKRRQLRELQLADLKLEKETAEMDLNSFLKEQERSQKDLDKLRSEISSIDQDIAAAEGSLQKVIDDIEHLSSDKETISVDELKSLKEENDELLMSSQKLEEKLLHLQQQREESEMMIKKDPQKNVDARKLKKKAYHEMRKAKKLLEKEVKKLDRQVKLHQRPNTVTVGGLGGEHQELVKDMIALDAKNQQLREKVAKMKENVTILRSQVNHAFRQWKEEERKRNSIKE